LLRLSRLTGQTELEEKVGELSKAFATQSDGNMSNTMFLAALAFSLGPSFEIVIVGELQSQGVKEVLQTLRSRFLPNTTILFKQGNDEQLEAIAEYIKPMTRINNQTTIYVCRNYTCNTPTNNLNEVLNSIK